MSCVRWRLPRPRRRIRHQRGIQRCNERCQLRDRFPSEGEDKDAPGVKRPALAVRVQPLDCQSGLTVRARRNEPKPAALAGRRNCRQELNDGLSTGIAQGVAAASDPVRASPTAGELDEFVQRGLSAQAGSITGTVLIRYELEATSAARIRSDLRASVVRPSRRTRPEITRRLIRAWRSAPREARRGPFSPHTPGSSPVVVG